MGDTKYIIMRGAFGEEKAVIFDGIMSHDFFKGYAIAAGFVAFNKTKDGKIEVYAYGKSDSLDIESRKEDNDLICKALNNNYADTKLFIPSK